jgi:hypothetical protein
MATATPHLTPTSQPARRPWLVLPDSRRVVLDRAIAGAISVRIEVVNA